MLNLNIQGGLTITKGSFLYKGSTCCHRNLKQYQSMKHSKVKTSCVDKRGDPGVRANVPGNF